jgi:hypothetical protein
MKHLSDAVVVEAHIQQETLCELLEPARPAKYRCEPILSAIEEASLESQAAPAPEGSLAAVAPGFATA